MINPACLSPLYKDFPMLTGTIYAASIMSTLQLLSNIMSIPPNKKIRHKNLKLFPTSIITRDNIRYNIAQMTSTIQPMSLAFMSP